MTLTLDNSVGGAAADQPNEALPLRLYVTLEVALYAVLAVIALLLRAAQVGHAPLGDSEAREALAALRAVNGQVAGEALIAHSPWTFLLHGLGFTFLGTSDAVARLPSVLGGTLLAVSPVLWRRYLHPLPPLIISVLLTVSPVGVLASRTSSPVVWSLLLAVVGSWLALRFVETRQEVWAVGATMALGGLALLVEPAGFLLLMAMGFGFIFAWLTETDPDTDLLGAVREVWRVWPWGNGLLAVGVLSLMTATGFFLMPSGLTALGEALWTGLDGFVSRPVDVPIAFPLWIALRYEPAILLFGIPSCYRAMREGSFFERVLVGWFLMGLVLSLAYAGGSAAHALWLTVPLTVLVGLAVTRWLTDKPESFWAVPDGSVILHGLVTLALWIAFGVSVMMLGKVLLLDLPEGVTKFTALRHALLEGIYSRDLGDPDWVTVQGVLVPDYVLGQIQRQILMASAFFFLPLVLFFVAGTASGARAAWYGLALGTFGVLLLFGMGAGLRAAYLNWDDPRELWYVQPVTEDVRELRATLEEMSLRDTGDPYLIHVTAQVPEDGALAWALRSFPNTVFVDGVGPEVKTAAVLTPTAELDPRLGADYVGKDLVIRLWWDRDIPYWRDGIMWIYNGDSRVSPQPDLRLNIWIQKDVYGVERVTEE